MLDVIVDMQMYICSMVTAYIFLLLKMGWGFQMGVVFMWPTFLSIL